MWLSDASKQYLVTKINKSVHLQLELLYNTTRYYAKTYAEPASEMFICMFNTMADTVVVETTVKELINLLL